MFQIITKKLILIIIASVFAAVALFFGYQQVNYQDIKLNQAIEDLNKFKTAKALKTLAELQKRSKKKLSQEVQFLSLYAQVKANDYKAAEVELEKLTAIPKKFRQEFETIVQSLTNSEKSDLVLATLKKAKELRLKQEFFITLSEAKNDINNELNVLEYGIAYLNSIKAVDPKTHIDSTKLEKYLLKRYVEIANIYRGSHKPAEAIKYLTKAQQMNILKGVNFEDEVYLNIAMTFKELRQYSKSWDYFKKAAELGNERAIRTLKKAKDRYRS